MFVSDTQRSVVLGTIEWKINPRPEEVRTIAKATSLFPEVSKNFDMNLYSKAIKNIDNIILPKWKAATEEMPVTAAIFPSTQYEGLIREGVWGSVVYRLLNINLPCFDSSMNETYV